MRDVAHLPVRVERREVHRHVGAKMFDDPLRHTVQLGIGVVLARDQQCCRLEPRVGLVTDVLERFQHRREMAAADLVIETIGERLEIDVGRVHRLEEFGARFRIDVTGRYGHRLDAALATGGRHVDRILEEDDRVVVRVGDAAATEFSGGLRKTLGRRAVGQRVHFPRLAHVPVLAELAGEVAARGAERQHAGARVEMVERFLFDRIDTESRRATVGDQLDFVVEALAHITQAALAFAQTAVARADVALQASIRFAMPVGGADDSFLHT